MLVHCTHGPGVFFNPRHRSHVPAQHRVQAAYAYSLIANQASFVIGAMDKSWAEAGAVAGAVAAPAASEAVSQAARMLSAMEEDVDDEHYVQVGSMQQRDWVPAGGNYSPRANGVMGLLGVQGFGALPAACEWRVALRRSAAERRLCWL